MSAHQSAFIQFFYQWGLPLWAALIGLVLWLLKVVFRVETDNLKKELFETKQETRENSRMIAHTRAEVGAIGIHLENIKEKTDDTNALVKELVDTVNELKAG